MNKVKFCVIRKNYLKAIKLFSIAVGLGNTDAMIALGKIYQYGKGVEKSFEKAKHYYNQAAEAGSAYGEYKLGNLYAEWDGSEKDLSASLYFYTQSADHGDKWGAFNAGMAYYNGKIISKNYAKAVYYLKLAVEAGIIVTTLARIYLYGGYGVQKDNQKALHYVDVALKELKTRTNEAVIEAKEKLISTILVEIGIDFEKDGNYIESMRLFQQAWAFKNIAISTKCLLALMFSHNYYDGKYVEQNFTESFQYYEILSNIEGCELDFIADAYTWLGRMYFIGRGTQKDIPKSFEFLEKAYNLDYTKAAKTLCVIYVNGYEVERDFHKAIPYCEKGFGENKCDVILGRIYRNTKQYEKALQCFKNILEEGDEHPYGAFLLAVMYANGEGVKKNLDIAKEWIEKSDASFKRNFLELLNKGNEVLHVPDNKSHTLGYIGLTPAEEASFFNISGLGASFAEVLEEL